MKRNANRKQTSKTYTVLLIILILSALVGIGGVSVYNRAQAKRIEEAKASGFVPKSKRDIAREEEIKKRLMEEEEARRKAEIELAPGKNHNQKANAYAYPTADVAKWMAEGTPDGEKIAFLTFDDGPNLTNTPFVMDTLQELGVPATFFIVGGNITEENSDVLRREIREGHAIGFHSYTHNYELLYPGRFGDAARILEEAKLCEKAISSIFGKDFRTGSFRYPGGHMSWNALEEADAKLLERGYTWMDWNALTGDAEPDGIRPTDIDGMVDFLEMTIHNSGIPDALVVLMHDAEGKILTREALPKIVERLRSLGYTRFGVLQ